MATAKAAKSATRPFTFTLRDIEKHDPCDSGYWEFLDVIKSNPVPGGPYARYGDKKRRSKYGPDAPIALNEVAPIMTNEQICWIVEHLMDAASRNRIYKLVVQIRDNSYRWAIAADVKSGILKR